MYKELDTEKMLVPVKLSNLSSSVVNICPGEVIAELHVCEPVEPDSQEQPSMRVSDCHQQDTFLELFDFTGMSVTEEDGNGWGIAVLRDWIQVDFMKGRLW